MPNIKSAKKRVQIAAKNNAANAAARSEMKTVLKKNLSSVEAGNVDAAKSDLVQSVKVLDKAVSKGLIHKNKAARKKSRMAKKVNAMA